MGGLMLSPAEEPTPTCPCPEPHPAGVTHEVGPGYDFFTAVGGPC